MRCHMKHSRKSRIMLAIYIQFTTPKKKQQSVSERINAFMKANPDAFNEFESVQNAGLESIRELTKNDSW